MIGLTAPKTIAQEAYIYALPMVMAYGIMYGYPPKAGRFREFCRCVLRTINVPCLARRLGGAWNAPYAYYRGVPA